MVKVTLNGKGDCRNITIDKSIVDPNDVGMLEDLIMAAFGDAKAQIEKNLADEMSKITGGMNLPPGMKLPF
jgi:DNA-binding YbaB/EbfC family protein